MTDLLSRASGHGVAAWYGWIKRAAARFFFEQEAPMIDAWLVPVTNGSDLVGTIDTAIF